MKNRSSRNGILIFMAFASIVFISFAHVVLAKDNALSTKGLALSPIRTETTVASGELVKYKLTLTNYSDQPMKVTLSAEEFSVVDQQYKHAFDNGTSSVGGSGGDSETVSGASGGARNVSGNSASDAAAGNGGAGGGGAGGSSSSNSYNGGNGGDFGGGGGGTGGRNGNGSAGTAGRGGDGYSLVEWI